MSKNLKFFNKKGTPINLSLDSDGVWRGNVFLDKVSEGLFENQQIFVLEEVINASTLENELSYPHTLTNTLGDGSFGPYWRTRWESNYYGDAEVDQIIFTYVISEDSSLGSPVISNYNNMTMGVILDPLSYIDPISGKVVTDVITSEAMKIGVAINSFSGGEGVYQRKLIVEDISTSSPVKIFEIDFYGQIVGEDERLKVLLDNFGQAINLEDSLIFRDHNPEEPLPNYLELNTKRKELLLVRDEIFNYLGAYRGLINAIKFFGYQDLTIKEYWLNLNWRDPNQYDRTIISNKTVYDQLITTGFINDAIASQGNGKYKQVVTYGLFDGEYRLNLSDPGVELPSNTWRKTSLFSLVYNLNKVVPGEFDDYGYPVVEDNFLFDPEEVLIKLYGLKRKLQQGYLPTNSKIVDISGEGVYFMVYNVRNWNDEMSMNTINSGLDVSFSVFPKTGYVEDLRYFGAKSSLTGVDFPWFAGTGATGISLFGNRVSSFYNGEKYPPPYVAGMVNAIYEFYSQKDLGNIYFDGSSDQLVEDYGLTGPNPFRTASGMPIVLTFNTPDYTWSDMTMTWDQLGLPFYSEVQNINGIDVEVYIPDPNQKLYTWDSLKFSNFYEIEWTISKSKNDTGLPYYFNIRGSIYDYYNLPHFLPYTGKYDVTCKVYDSFGHVSSQTVFNFIEVKPYDLEIKVWTRYRESSDYTWENTVKPWKDYESPWSYIAEGQSEQQTGFPMMIFDFAKYLRDNNKESLVRIQKVIPASSSKAYFRFDVDYMDIVSITSYFSSTLSISQPPVLTPLVVKTATPHGRSVGDVIYIKDSYYEVDVNGNSATTNGYWEVTEVLNDYEFRIPLDIDFLTFGGWSSSLDQYSNTVGYEVDPNLYPSQKLIVEGGIIIEITDPTENTSYKYINISTGPDLGNNASNIANSFNNLRTFPPIYAKYKLTPSYCDVELYFDSQYGSKYNGSVLKLSPYGSFGLISSDRYFYDGSDEIIEESLLDDILDSGNIPGHVAKFGFGVTLSSVSRNQWSEFYSQTWDSYDFHGDFLGGFQIHNIQQGDYIKVYSVTGGSIGISGGTLGEIAQELDTSPEIGISNFDYRVLPEGVEDYSPGAGITGLNFFPLTGAISSRYAPPSIPGAPILPTAEFSSSTTGPIQGEYVQLFDESTGGNPAIAWSWTVEGAYFATGASFTNNGPTSQNPWVYWKTYRVEGFTVSLISYSIDGPSNPNTKVGYIHVSSGIPSPSFDWLSPSYFQYPSTQYIIGGGTGSAGDIISFNYDSAPQASSYYEWEISSPGYSGSTAGFSLENISVQFQWNNDAEQVSSFTPLPAYDYVQFNYPYGSYASESYLNLRVTNLFGTGITAYNIPVVRCSNYPDYAVLLNVTADSQDSPYGVLTVGATAINRTHYGTTGGWLGNLVYNQSISRSGYIGRIVQAENVESGDTQIYVESLTNFGIGITFAFETGDPIQIGYVRDSPPPVITDFTVSPSQLYSPGGTASFIDSSIAGTAGIIGRTWEIGDIGGTSATGPSAPSPFDYYYDLSSEEYAVGKFAAALTVVDGNGVTGIKVTKNPAVSIDPSPYQYFDSIITGTGSHESYRIYIGQVFNSWIGGSDPSIPAKEVNDLPGSTVYTSSLFSNVPFTNNGNTGSTSSNPRFVYGPSYFANGSSTGPYNNTLTGLYVTSIPIYGTSTVTKNFSSQVNLQNPPTETVSSIIWTPEVSIDGQANYINVIDNSLYYPYERKWMTSDNSSFVSPIQTVIGYNPLDSYQTGLSNLNPGQSEVWIKLETYNDYQGMVSPLQQGIDQIIHLPVVSAGSGLVSSFYTDKVDSIFNGISDPVNFYSNSTDWEGISLDYSWDFGAGASPQNATGSGPHSVFWDSIGTKTVYLTVSNEYGISSTYSSNINVQNATTDSIFGSKITIDGNDYSATGYQFDSSSTNPLPWATGITVSVVWNTGITYGVPTNFYWTLPDSIEFYDSTHNFYPATSSARLIIKDPGATGIVSIMASNSAGTFDFNFMIKDSAGITGFASGVTMMYVKSKDVGYETNSPTGYVYSINSNKYDPIVASLTNAGFNLNYTSLDNGPSFAYGSFPPGLNNQRITGETRFLGKNYISSHSMGAYPSSTGSIFSISYDMNAGYSIQPKDSGDFVSVSANSNSMFAVTAGGMRKTTDGDNWSDVSTIPVTPGDFTSILADSDIVYVGASGGIYYSEDQGSTWSTATTGLTDTNVITISKVGNTIYSGTNSWIYSGVGSGTGFVFELDKDTMTWNQVPGLTADVLRIFDYNGYPAVLSKDSSSSPMMSIDYYDGVWNNLGFSEPYFNLGKLTTVGGYPDAICVDGVIYVTSDSSVYSPLGVSLSKNSVASPNSWSLVVDATALVTNAFTKVMLLEENFSLGDKPSIVIDGNQYKTMVLDCSLVDDMTPLMITRNNLGGPLAAEYQKMSKYVYTSGPNGVASSSNPYLIFDVYPGLSGDLLGYQLNYQSTLVKGAGNSIDINFSSYSFTLGFDSASGNVACSNYTSSPAVYWSDSSIFADTTVLYNDEYLTTLAATGYYSDGVRYGLNTTSITIIDGC